MSPSFAFCSLFSIAIFFLWFFLWIPIVTSKRFLFFSFLSPLSSPSLLYPSINLFPVVKLRLTRLNTSDLAVAKFTLGSRLEVLKHGPLLGGEMRGRLSLWLERDATCVGNLSRHHPDGGIFLVTGTVTGNRLLVNKAYGWSKRNRNLTNAARKWKRHRCRG